MNTPELRAFLPCPGAPLGDFHTSRVVLLGRVPQDAPAGSQLRAMYLLAGETWRGDSEDFWVFQVGSIATGVFKLQREFSLAGGLVENVEKVIPYLDPVTYSRGELVAVRLNMSGAPAPLIGLSCVPEWGILSVQVSK